jgi:HD-GYP domain-containing protein (c-di-GMP phosphodiesterase class II)
MRRVILHDGGPRVAAAAARLAPEYDVHPLSGEAAHAVVIVGPDSTARAGAAARVIGLVEPGDAGPWPEDWYAVLPLDAPAAMLARAVDNAFADLDAEADLGRLERHLAELNTIGIRLSAEANPRFLLETILSKAREITSSDAGSVYIVDQTGSDGRHLRFALAQNDSVDVPFRTATLPLTHASVAGHVALTGRIVNLADAYAPPPDSPFTINRWFDEQAHYRTKSMLVVPMRTPQGETIGVLQLINCKEDWHGRLTTPAEVDRQVRPYGPRHEKLAGSLASQAAVAIHNRRLYLSIRDLFEGFVTASVTAIEARDPTTSGHSFRVADLTVALAEVVDRCDSGPYAAVRFGADEMMEIRYASLLHDFGKVGVREHVLVKSKKLYPAELERIRHRVEVLKRELTLRVARAKLDAALARRDDYAAVAARLDAELAAALTDLDRQLDLIVVANEPSVQARDLSADIAAIAGRVWHDADGAPRAILMPEEARMLAIPRGSLTDAERRDIQDHVVHTYEFLSRIPWTRELRRVPEIAGAHHEKLNGTGYPNAARGEQIPLQARMMAIADIYDALTARDRPYKKAVRPEEALDILDAERRAGALDGALLDLFIAARVYERAARRDVPARR